MRRHAAVVAHLTLALLAAGSLQGGQERLPHDTGQSVTPVYEGWYRNQDGTFSLSFGYLNRNLKEEIDIPVGPANYFAPGPADRGQPTHFAPRTRGDLRRKFGARAVGVFAVVVPKEFGTAKLTWTLSVHGETWSIPAHLDPLWEIDALDHSATDNMPPMLRFGPTSAPGLGPGGVTGSVKATVNVPVTLNVWTSYSKPGRPATGPGASTAAPITVRWQKYRGPGTVTFSNVNPPVDEASGRSTTSATLSSAGEYVLRVVASDPAGIIGTYQCCWTNGYLRVHVGSASGGTP